MTTPFGKAVRKMRIDKGVTMKDMADVMEVKSAYLSAVEMGRKRITDKYLEQVVSYFAGVDGVDVLPKLVDCSQPDMKVDLQGQSDDDRELMVAFARKFSDLSSDSKDVFREQLGLM
ncbi:helix-turn-helix transcriptional regulator [Haliea sp. E1-2-M8]|uniref:helix-turn-helix domain-containing protein n=1 Tax=Haliea sp. E1-2-M8 TaxID=3064706 RepID=UPI002716BC67|nr:helix-turn-helix transcriptional regulator [Haliea sp. E1-2-M8]MDO8864192.1 helix-turn-helix transcriptional regulator [Haliea sp. E1-2-M8]